MGWCSTKKRKELLVVLERMEAKGGGGGGGEIERLGDRGHEAETGRMWRAEDSWRRMWFFGGEGEGEDVWT